MNIADTEQKIQALRHVLNQSDAVIVGAGAGLSASAGYDYTGERFQKYFRDFSRKYGFSDMYSGGFYPFDSPEEYWAYWSRYIYINRYMKPQKPVYQRLSFLKNHRTQQTLFLELGVGMNTPGIIKYPFWRMTAENPRAAYACINYGPAVCPQEIKEQSICINGDIGEILREAITK